MLSLSTLCDCSTLNGTTIGFKTGGFLVSLYIFLFFIVIMVFDNSIENANHSYAVL
jgi:hypothetical protein